MKFHTLVEVRPLDVSKVVDVFDRILHAFRYSIYHTEVEDIHIQ